MLEILSIGMFRSYQRHDRKSCILVFKFENEFEVNFKDLDIRNKIHNKELFIENYKILLKKIEIVTEFFNHGPVKMYNLTCIILQYAGT